MKMTIVQNWRIYRIKQIMKNLAKSWLEDKSLLLLIVKRREIIIIFLGQL